jgi:WD40 repeat protein
MSRRMRYLQINILLNWNGKARLILWLQAVVKSNAMICVCRGPKLTHIPVLELTQLQWRDDILAIAVAGCVRLWDVRYFSKRAPLQELRHEGVKGLGFSCPLQRNVLATGGANGVKLWNVQSGSLRATIPTPEPVTSLSWSPHRKEIMASYGEVMAVWSLAPQVHRLAK